MLGDLFTKTCKIIPFGDYTGSTNTTKLKISLNIYPNIILLPVTHRGSAYGFKNALNGKLEGVDLPRPTLNPLTEGKIGYCGLMPSAYLNFVELFIGCAWNWDNLSSL